MQSKKLHYVTNKKNNETKSSHHNSKIKLLEIGPKLNADCNTKNQTEILIGKIKNCTYQTTTSKKKS